MRVRHFIFFFAVCALVSLVAYGAWLITGASRATAHANLATRGASTAEEKLLTAAPPMSTPCPKSSGVILPASTQTGHHKVLLTWKASTSYPDRKRKAVGYCLYRSSTQNIAAKDPKCNSCEQVNQKPIPGTACVDQWVKDGAKYYYVVLAVNEDGEPSSLSTDALAEIPPSPQVTGNVIPDSYPLCRAENVSHR